MISTDISSIVQRFSCSETDWMHVLQNSLNYKNLILSYKTHLGNLSSVFEIPSHLDLSLVTNLVSTLRNDIGTLSNSILSLANSIPTKAEMNNTYIRKDIVEGKIPALLTNSAMETELAKYANNDLMQQRAAQARMEAQKLADEITDFAGAAMVGIMQANSGGETSPVLTT